MLKFFLRIMSKEPTLFLHQETTQQKGGKHATACGGIVWSRARLTAAGRGGYVSIVERLVREAVAQVSGAASVSAVGDSESWPLRTSVPGCITARPPSAFTWSSTTRHDTSFQFSSFVPYLHNNNQTTKNDDDDHKLPGKDTSLLY